MRLFKTAIDMMTSDAHKIVIQAVKTPTGERVRRFNVLTIDEVAIIIVGGQSQPRAIVFPQRNDQLIKVVETHGGYDALHYSIIFLGLRWWISLQKQIDKSSQWRRNTQEIRRNELLFISSNDSRE